MREKNFLYCISKKLRLYSKFKIQVSFLLFPRRELWVYNLLFLSARMSVLFLFPTLQAAKNSQTKLNETFVH